MKRIFISRLDNIVSLLMPALLVTMTITHSVVYFYLIIALALIRINKPFVILPVYFISSLSTGWFAIEEGLSAGRYLSILLMASLLIDMMIKKRINNSSGDIILVVLFLVYCFVSSALSLTGEFDAFFMMLQSLGILLLFMLRINNDADNLFDRLFYSAIIVIIGISIKAFSEGLDALVDMRYGGDMADGVNANRIAMMLAQLGAIFGVSTLLQGLKFRGVISILGLLIVGFITVLTGSRTGLIAVIFPFLLLVFMFSKRKMKQFFLPLLVLSIVFAFAYNWIVGQDLAVLERLSVQDVVDTGGADRMRAIRIMMKNVWPDYPLFGVGLGGGNFVAAATQYGMKHPCHNIFFDSLCQLGLVGFMLFFVIVFRIFRKTYAYSKEDNNILSLLGFSLLLAGIMNGIGETVYVEKLFWNAISICVIGNSSSSSLKRLLSNGKI